MPEKAYSPPPGFLTFTQAMERLSYNKPKLQRAVKAGRLTAYRDPHDQRVRLFRVEDVEALAAATPEPEKKLTARDERAA